MDILESLGNLNLSEKEAKVYSALLGLGNASVYSIAQKSGLKRPTAYVVIGELVKKGIVSRIPRLKKQLYQAKAPEELIADAENKLRLVKQKLPELQALVKNQNNKPTVYYFDGLIGSQQAMQYGLKRLKGKEMQVFWATVSKKTMEQFGGFKDFLDTIRNNDINVRGIAPDDGVLKGIRDSDLANNRNIKRLPLETYNPTVSFEIGDSFVKIQDFDNLQNVIIENENITRTMRQIFEMVWKSTKSE